MLRNVQLDKENLYKDILQQLGHVNSVVFASSHSSKMSICSSLAALMALSFSSQLMKIRLYFSVQLYYEVGVIL